MPDALYSCSSSLALADGFTPGNQQLSRMKLEGAGDLPNAIGGLRVGLVLPRRRDFPVA